MVADLAVIPLQINVRFLFLKTCIFVLLYLYTFILIFIYAHVNELVFKHLVFQKHLGCHGSTTNVKVANASTTTNNVYNDMSKGRFQKSAIAYDKKFGGRLKKLDPRSVHIHIPLTL